MRLNQGGLAMKGKDIMTLEGSCIVIKIRLEMDPLEVMKNRV